MIALVAGMALGLVYFGGLWLTVRRLPSTARPGLLMMSSLWGRLGVCIAGFYVVTEGKWMPVAFCLLGFLTARSLMVRHFARERL